MNLLDRVLQHIPKQYVNIRANVEREFNRAYTGTLLTKDVAMLQNICIEDLPVYLQDITENEFYGFTYNVEIDWGIFQEQYLEWPLQNAFDLQEKQNEFRDNHVIPWLWANWSKYEGDEFQWAWDPDCLEDCCNHFNAISPDDTFYIEQIVKEFFDERIHEDPAYRKVENH